MWSNILTIFVVGSISIAIDGGGRATRLLRFARFGLLGFGTASVALEYSLLFDSPSSLERVENRCRDIAKSSRNMIDNGDCGRLWTIIPQWSHLLFYVLDQERREAALKKTRPKATESLVLKYLERERIRDSQSSES